MDAYLSPCHRDNAAGGCPTAGLAAAIRHQALAARSAITEGLRSQIDRTGKALPELDAADRRRAAIGSWAAMAGAVILDRAIDDPTLPDEVLEQTRAWVDAGINQVSVAQLPCLCPLGYGPPQGRSGNSGPPPLPNRRRQAPFADAVRWLPMTPDLAFPSRPLTLCWRRIDMVGLELLELRRSAEGLRAESSVLCGWAGGFRLDHAWDLTPDWRVLSLRIERQDANGRRTLVLERDGEGWRIDGGRRPDLDGAEEPDLSVTPFCNTLVIRRMPPAAGGSLAVDTAYVNGDDLSVTRSRQRYDHEAPGRFRYVDLGVAAGFEADLAVDEEGLVRRYQHLFELVEVGD